MARRSAKSVEEAPKKPKKVSKVDPNVKVSSVKIPSRSLITFGVDHPIWSNNKAWAIPDLKGAIVRLWPPHDTKDEIVNAAKDLLMKEGVARIKLETRKGVVLPNEAIQKAKPTKSTPREVVLQLVSESNSADESMLLGVVEQIMGEVGI